MGKDADEEQGVPIETLNKFETPAPAPTPDDVKGIVEGVARETKKWGDEGKFSQGFKINGEWFNLEHEDQVKLNDMVAELGLKRGDTVQFKRFGNNKMKEIKILEKGKSKEFGDQTFGKDIVGLETLLAEAHKMGLSGIKTECISHNPEKKEATFKVTAEFTDEKGNKKYFSAHGDANQLNTSDTIKQHYYRMSETRALCRCFRWALDRSSVTKEELCNNEESKKSME